MRRYSSFKQDQSAGTTHFWRFLRVLELRLGLEAGQALWTNLNRCDHLGGRPTLIEDRLWSAFPVLCDELKILRPTAVVFVTGPSYDALLVRRLGASLVPVRGFATAAFARVESPGLLPPESFRTYHPNFLCRFRASSVPRIVNYIAKRVRQDAARLEPRPALRGRVAAARAPE